MARERVFIPQPIPEAAHERLQQLADVEVFPHVDRRITQEELLAAAPGTTILYALGEVPFDAELIEAATDLRLIAAMHTRASFVDIPAATARGIPVTGTTTLNRTSVAELTMALMLGLFWRLLEADRFTREGRWQQNQSMAFLTTALADKTVGIVGFGRIGQAVARRCQAFGMDVLYSKRNRMSLDDEREFRASWRGLDALFEESDVVVLCAPLTRETMGMVDTRRLALMKPSAYLINTSRGHLVLEQDLIEALRAGTIAGAGLDVYEREVPEPDPGPSAELQALDNVLFTPHIGSAARETRELMAGFVVDSIGEFLAGRRPPVVLNPEVYGEEAVHDERLS